MLFSILTLAAALVGPQSAPQQTAPATPAPGTAAPSAPAPAAPVTDTEVRQFATAAITITRAQQNTAAPAQDRSKTVADAVAASGIAPARFSQIAQAMQTDPALKNRIQTAALAQIQAPGR